jgi:predicted regulator of Ras-like GTPase activity (Roadblock/LC7/MglB family)
MVNNGPVEDILGELNSNPEIVTSVLVSRSGMHISGNAPNGVHLETFVAMSAILLGSAETAISDIKGELDNILVEMDRSRIVISSAGNKALLVVVTNTKDNFPTLLDHIKKASGDIASSL